MLVSKHWVRSKLKDKGLINMMPAEQQIQGLYELHDVNVNSRLHNQLVANDRVSEDYAMFDADYLRKKIALVTSHFNDRNMVQYRKGMKW